MDLKKEIDKNNLHHAYLIEGQPEQILPEVLNFIKSFGFGSECVNINLDSFKVDDARNLKSFVSEKSFSDKGRFFIIAANSFLLEAQNMLLKIFEEPAENTHFFIITPDIDSLLRTLVSRFYVLRAEQNLATEIKEAEKFLKLSLGERLDFMQKLLPKKEDSDEEVITESNSSKALKFLNALESTLHKKISKGIFDTACFEQIFQVRKFLRQPGSSVKTLMESVALIIPERI